MKGGRLRIFRFFVTKAFRVLSPFTFVFLLEILVSLFDQKTAGFFFRKTSGSVFIFRFCVFQPQKRFSCGFLILCADKPLLGKTSGSFYFIFLHF